MDTIIQYILQGDVKQIPNSWDIDHLLSFTSIYLLYLGLVRLVPNPLKINQWEFFRDIYVPISISISILSIRQKAEDRAESLHRRGLPRRHAQLPAAEAARHRGLELRQGGRGRGIAACGEVLTSQVENSGWKATNSPCKFHVM